MIHKPDVLDEIGQLYMTELDKLALSELKPSYKLEQIKSGNVPDAANDGHFDEVA